MESKEIVLEYSNEEIAKMKAEGIDDDAIPASGKHIFKRVPPDRVFSLEKSKMRINIFLDSEIVHHFRKRAEKPNAAPYQTQINSELRAIMERDLAQEKAEIDETAKRLLDDDEFLSSLAEKLKDRELLPR